MANAVFDQDTRTAYLAVHLTNGAWGPKWKSFRALRRRRWRTQVHRLRALIQELRHGGWTVVVGGDLNTGPQMPVVSLHPEAVVAIRAALMHLVVIPAEGVQVRVSSARGDHRVFTDHAFIRATLHFRRGA